MKQQTTRGSTRLKEGERLHIIDESTRRRRLRKFMENLEADNHHEEPHADLIMSKKVPKFDDNLESRTRSKKKDRGNEYYANKYRKTFQQLVEEGRKQAEENGEPSYLDLAPPKSDRPPLHLCSVCGFFSKYVCISCGARVCQIKCFQAHFETRCLKWTG